MKDYLESFYFSLAEEITPDAPDVRASGDKEFAVILGDGDTLSPSDIENISKRTSLSPIFFAISRDVSLDISRLYSRWLGAPLIIPRGLSESVSAMRECNFTVCENSVGALFSFISRTPAYLNSSSDGCREIIAEFSGEGFLSSVFIPYTKGRTELIKRTTVDRGLYSAEIKKLRASICTKLLGILNKD